MGFSTNLDTAVLMEKSDVDLTKERIPKISWFLFGLLGGVPFLLDIYQLFASAGFYPSADWMRLFHVSTILLLGSLSFIIMPALRKSGRIPPIHPSHNPWIFSVGGFISLYLFCWSGYGHGAASILTRLIGDETRQTYTVHVYHGKHAARADITSLDGLAFIKPAIRDADFEKFRHRQDLKVELDSRVSWFGTRIEGFQPLREVSDRPKTE